MFTTLYRTNVNTNKNLSKAHKSLEWFFHFSESAMGWKSNYSSMIRAWAFHKKHEDVDVEDQLIAILDSPERRENLFDAANKERKILLAFNQLSSRHQSILTAYFEEKNPEIDTKVLFDKKLYTSLDKNKKEIELDGLMPGLRLLSWTKTAKSVEDFSLAWLKKAVKKSPEQFSSIREEADELYFKALKAFSKNYKG